MQRIGIESVDYLVDIAREKHRITVDRDTIDVDDRSGDKKTLSEAKFLSIADEIGLDVVIEKLAWRRLKQLDPYYPCIALLENGDTLLLSGFEPNKTDRNADALFIVQRIPSQNRSDIVPVERCENEHFIKGKVYIFNKKEKNVSEQRDFNLRWFVHEAMKQKVLFYEIAVVSLIIHGTTLAIPLFFQIIVDKVLVHESFSTLWTLTTAVVIVLIFECILKFLRDYLLAFATSKIDMRTAMRTFRHLLSLPLGFFQRSTAGVLTKHMQQNEEIREFLTGNVLETALDSTALIVFLPLLFLYSPKLGLIVLGFSIAIALVIALMLKPFYSALTQLYAAEGERQSLLVESVHGISTIKSLALEPKRNTSWEKSSADSVKTNFRVKTLGAIAEAIVGTLEHLMSVAILVFGALMIFEGSFTIGQLIAFKMISGHVSGPLVKIVHMIHEYQKARLAVEMLGEIMKTPIESNLDSQSNQPKLTGDVSFENVEFFYDEAENPAVKDITFEIKAGETIGIVGESGSGKSTLARLVQGLYSINAGKISLGGQLERDGSPAAVSFDLEEIELSHLRRSIGIVLQENFLFRGSVHDNIALTEGVTSRAEVKKAAEDAGADKFICDLPKGYETDLGENATTLSGGQRQRLAIARALLRQPQILIFDEATSALDVESETIVQANLREIARGRTMIIIAHRISTLREADRILVLKEGKIEQFAPPVELLDKKSLHFSETFNTMWEIQAENAKGLKA